MKYITGTVSTFHTERRFFFGLVYRLKFIIDVDLHRSVELVSKQVSNFLQYFSI